MSPEEYKQTKRLFHETLELSPIERHEFLSANCPDKELREAVEKLLAAHDEAEEFIEMPAVAFASDIFAEDWQNRRVGNYRIEGELGRGGMGVVFLASRADDEFRQKVALKIVQSALNTQEIRRPFRQERQILAGLEHPHIAPLLDGGTTSDGLPFFVMEYVEGLPVTEYCEAVELEENERLEMFRQVCTAVEYAHRHLVIHRDLKPSNILVTTDGIPKLLDFGIAKLLDTDAPTEQTATQMRVLTPEYASPEQVRGEKISTVSDIYSLGVILYELLTGERPFQTKDKSYGEIVKIVSEIEPIRPSSVVLRPSPVDRSKTSQSNEQGRRTKDEEQNR